ncbi:MAG TPA: hypothetical protein EYN95_10300 [Methylococcaceae bacterium]|nr:hypothetical protein [Methylococcaceae bacterium]
MKDGLVISWSQNGKKEGEGVYIEGRREDPKGTSSIYNHNQDNESKWGNILKFFVALSLGISIGCLTFGTHCQNGYWSIQ